jgi:hypothetical protein
MPEIRAPTLLIWGSRDTDTPLSAAEEMERLIPDAGLVVLEGAGHYSYLDQPTRFTRIVSHFIAPPAGDRDSPASPPAGGDSPAPPPVGDGNTPVLPSTRDGQSGDGSP